MSDRLSFMMTLTRTRTTEDGGEEEYDIEVEVTARNWEPADRSTGILSGSYQDIDAEDENGVKVILSQREQERASEKAYYIALEPDYDYRED